MKSALVTIMLMILTANVVSVFSAQNDRCFKCHNSPTLSVLEPKLGYIKSYHVDKESFSKSNHAKLDCIVCHKGEYGMWPHNNDTTKSLTCLSCHSSGSIFFSEKPEYAQKKSELFFNDIQSEFNSSIHNLRLGDKFSCFSCHDPHVFERNRLPNFDKISSDNAMCLNCHTRTEKFLSFTERSMPDINSTHKWLPNINLHLATVRCVDCHSSYDAPNLSHNILSKEQALRNCENCHTKEPKLFDKLYRYTLSEDRKTYGFVNGSLLSRAYVIGSTRNATLDTLSLLIFIATFGGILFHLILRIFTHKNKI
jgi:nitrate reductase cytochrome c-type subunit